VEINRRTSRHTVSFESHGRRRAFQHQGRRRIVCQCVIVGEVERSILSACAKSFRRTAGSNDCYLVSIQATVVLHTLPPTNDRRTR
jgi:hypothetical protein